MVHARENIRFNSLCPGPIRTPLLMDFLNTEEKKQRRLVHVPQGRFGEAIEQAYGALFLASDESSFVTGTDFRVDGGLASAYVVSIYFYLFVFIEYRVTIIVRHLKVNLKVLFPLTLQMFNNKAFYLYLHN